MRKNKMTTILLIAALTLKPIIVNEGKTPTFPSPIECTSVISQLPKKKGYLPSFFPWKRPQTFAAFQSRLSANQDLKTFRHFKMSFVGKFERVSHENYEEFLTAVDVNDVWKKAALSSTPIMEVNMIWLNYKHDF